ncbi:MAG TPA: carbohydrate porin [Candidatus Sulfotelmatobacter sp.]|nr:carbohydrate porin [Candidatus Sulfotelmatobacter sp.]
MKLKKQRSGAAGLRWVVALMGASAAAAQAQEATNGFPGQNSAPGGEAVSTNSPAVSALSAQQNWNFHAQSTAIVQGYPGFHSQYPDGPNSLPSGGQVRETFSLDLMGGVRLWRGAEAHIDGLMWQGFGLGNTVGIEGFPNGEAFRIGTSVPNGTIARLFIRQTIGFGGEQETISDDDFDLAGSKDVSRLTITVGRFSAKDIFDNNAYANDARTQFLNWGLGANLAWDYPADAIGFTTGIALELSRPKWTLRYGFFQVPQVQNELNWEDKFLTWPYNGVTGDGPFFDAWAMVTELERRYTVGDHPGTIRGLAFLNRAEMAEYSQATTLLQNGESFLDARTYHDKYGFGLNWEQEIYKNVGVFSRLGWNDDREEGWMFTDVGYSGSVGLSINGAFWRRPDDTFGLAGLANGCSRAEQEFFEAGGVGILAGDGAGQFNYGWEKILETCYDFKIWDDIHGAVDYQYVTNPAFNRDRGPVSIFAGRLHWEF